MRLRLIVSFMLLVLAVPSFASGFKRDDDKHDGVKFFLGFNIANPHFRAPENLFKEYNELRPNQQKAAPVRPNYFGLDFGYFIAEDRGMIRFDCGGINGNFNSKDSTGKLTSFNSKNVYFDFSFGGSIIEKKKFRFSLLAGLSLNMYGVKMGDKSVVENGFARLFATMFAPLFMFQSSSDRIHSHIWGGANLGAMMSFGHKNEFIIDYSYRIGMHQTNLKKTRQELNKQASSFQDSDFKSRMKYGTLRFLYAFG